MTIKHSRFVFDFYLRLIVSGNKKIHFERDFSVLLQLLFLEGLGRKATCETNQGLKILSFVLSISEWFIATVVSKRRRNNDFLERFPLYFYLTFPGHRNSLSVQPKYLSSYHLTLMEKVLKWQSLQLLEHIFSLKLSLFTFKAKTNYLNCI